VGELESPTQIGDDRVVLRHGNDTIRRVCPVPAATSASVISSATTSAMRPTSSGVAIIGWGGGMVMWRLWSIAPGRSWQHRCAHTSTGATLDQRDTPVVHIPQSMRTPVLYALRLLHTRPTPPAAFIRSPAAQRRTRLSPMAFVCRTRHVAWRYIQADGQAHPAPVAVC
jgi:hypothetical protein